MRPVVAGGLSVFRSSLGAALAALASVSLLAGCGADGGGPEAVQVSSGALAATQTYLVSFPGGGIPSNAAEIVAAAGGSIVTRYQNVGIVLARGGSAFATALRADGRVDSVAWSKAVSSSLGPVRPGHGGHGPRRSAQPGSDPLSNRQWDMDQIHAPQARAVSAGSKKVLVGIFDSGLDATHPDLAGQVVASASASCVGGVANADPSLWSNDVFGHGTHVAGIIAGARNGVGIVGVAPGVKVASVKVIVDDLNDPNAGLIFPDAFVCAVDWAIGHGYDLMNASLLIDPFTGPIDDIFCTDQPDRVGVIKMVRQAVLAAAKKKIPLIAATGNSFTDLSALPASTPGATCYILPAQAPTVIGVSAVGVTRQLSFYSNYGKGAVDLTGPGGDSTIPDPAFPDESASGQVLSSVPPNSLYYQWAAGWDGQIVDDSSGTPATYAYIQGTSQAAPHVTGVAALAISRYGKMGPLALRLLLGATATPLPCPVGPYDPGMTGTPATCTGTSRSNTFYGSGEVDALAVVR
jgi:subtilisin family serine protease